MWIETAICYQEICLSVDRHSSLGRNLEKRGCNRLILAILLHASQNHRLGCHSLPELRVSESLELLVMPLAGGDGPAFRIDKHGVVLSAQEVCNRVAVLGRVKGHDAMDAALELHAAGEAQRVADVDEGATGLGRNEAHLTSAASAGRSDLQTPLLTEEKREGADVGVLLVANSVLASELTGEVVHHGELLGVLCQQCETVK